MSRAIAINTGPFTHLDHLVPVCLHFNLPLIVTEESTYAMGKEFYPQVSLILKSPAQLSLAYLAKSFDTIFTCGKFWALELRPLLQFFQRKQVQFVFCPHGHSDKEAYLQKHAQVISQDIALVYGPQMKQLMTPCSNQTIPIGNLRERFYRNYQSHFDQLLKEKIPLNPRKKTILYAPTWETTATGSSFTLGAASIIDQLHGEYNLIVKPHPLLNEHHPVDYFLIEEKCTHLADVHFVDAFPAIYPLLEKSDIYLGDHSSIGYDFLLYNRPMFFLATQSDPLHQCGERVELNTIKHKIDHAQTELSEIRKKLYASVFMTVEEAHKLLEGLQAPVLSKPLPSHMHSPLLSKEQLL